MLALQGSGGGKGPARAAPALVLDLGDSTLSPPIDLRWGFKSLGCNEGGSYGVSLVLKNVKISMVIAAALPKVCYETSFVHRQFASTNLGQT